MSGILNAFLSINASIASNILKFGYVSGGTADNAGLPVNTYRKFSFTAETISTPSAVLSAAKELIGGFSNSGVAGYTVGQSASSDKLNFTTDTNSSLTSQLSTGSDLKGCADTATKGYIFGQSLVVRVAFPTDTNSTLASTPWGRLAGAALQNKSTAVYFAGGNFDTPINKITLPSETPSTLASVLPSSFYLGGQASNDGVAGYTIGGDGSTGNANKILYSTETLSSLPSILTLIVERFGNMDNRGVASYNAGGTIISTGLDTNVIRKLSFTTDTGSAVTATLTLALRNPASFSNNGVY